MLVIIALIIRGVSFEYRGKVEATRWRPLWSWMLTIGSVLLPVLVGIASSSYSLTVMTGVALVFFPLVLLYQGWTYYVFRGRIRGPREGSTTPAH